MVQDIQTNAEYALKRLLGSDSQACNNIIREISIHKQVSAHPNVVRYVAASFIDRTNGGAQGSAEYLLVSELCKGLSFFIRFFFRLENKIFVSVCLHCAGGSLVDCLHSDIEPETVLRIIYQATQAVKHLHFQSIPISHRDIKVSQNAFHFINQIYKNRTHSQFNIV